MSNKYGLNSQQYLAVTANMEHSLVLAGAGAGKTKTLISRIQYLLEKGIPPYQIMAITFTNKAAKEMRERLDTLKENDYTLVKIGTFHSIALNFIKEEYKAFGFEEKVSVIDEKEQNEIVGFIIKSHHIQDISISDANDFITKIKESDTDIESIQPTPRTHKLIEVFKHYQKYLTDKNLIDFSGLLILFRDRLRDDKDYRQKMNGRFVQILVDEFQDTNLIQFEILSLLCEKASLFCVGDDSQSIYKFRGANIDNIFKFRDEWAKNTFLLEQNYRSTKNIVNFSNEAISLADKRLEKSLFTENEDGDEVAIIFPNDDFQEAELIAKQIKMLHEKRDVEYSDIAIIYRSNDLSEKFEKAFLKEGIPYQVTGKLNLFKDKFVKQILDLLKIINNEKYNSVELISIMKNCPFLIKPTKKMFEEAQKYAEYNHISIEAYLRKYQTSHTKLFFEKIDYLRKQTNILYWQDWYHETLKLLNFENVKKSNSYSLSLLEELFLETCENYLGQDKVGFFVHKIDQVKTLTHIGNKVNLTTIHASKGLEYDYVYLPSFEDGIIPSVKSIEDDIEEERRLAYVAFTRAKKKLVISCCQNRLMYGKYYSLPPSRYISKLPESLYYIPKQFNRPLNWGEEFDVEETLIADNKNDFKKHINRSKQKKVLKSLFS